MKTKIKVLCYSEQDLTPKAQSTIREIVNDGFPDHDVRFGDYYLTDEYPVLVFGNRGPTNFLRGTKFVYTYSIAQIMTKANAATVLRSAIRQFIEEPEPIPFTKCIATFTLPFEWFDVNRPMAIDIETTGNLGVDHTPEEVDLLSIAFYQPGRAPIVMVGRDEGQPLDDRQKNFLISYLPHVRQAIYHNGKFDVRVLNRILDLDLCVWYDTMLAHHVLNMAAGDHKLKHLAKLYLGAPDWEEGISKYTKGGGYYENIPRRMLVDYNGFDVYWTYKLFELFQPQIEADENYQKAFMFEMELAKFLLKVEKVGIPFDVEYADSLSSDLSVDADKYLKELQSITKNDKFNPGSHVQVKKFLAEQGHELSSSDEDHITELINSRPSARVLLFCENLLMWRKATKMRSTYAEGWKKHSREGRVHPTFLVHGTSTGRLSSTGPNAQNVPREKRIRRLVSEPGIGG